MALEYRKRIYKRYGSQFQGAGIEFDARAAERWARAYDWYLRGWLPENKDAAIIDLGCGYGRLLSFFKQRGYTNIRGVDISPDQVQIARQIVPDVFQGNVLDFVSDAPREGSYDLVTSLDLIEHFKKNEVLQFLDGCFRVLKAGGRLVLQTPNAETPWGTYCRYGDLTHEVCFQHNSITQLLKLCGFDRVEAREMGPVPWGYSVTGTLRWLLWQSIRLRLKLYNLAETGSTGSGVFTRVFIVSAMRGK